MRSFLLLLVGLVLAGAGQNVYASLYQYEDGWQHQFHVVGSPTCASVVADYIAFSKNFRSADVGGEPIVYYWNGDCFGSWRAVGDVLTTSLEMRSGGVFSHVGALTFTLLAIREDDMADDISSINVQRVLVMIGCALMFGLGMVVGKA